LIPKVDIDEALSTVHDRVAPAVEPRAVVVVRTENDLSAVADALKRL
jgi:hypothetical protein